MDDNVPSKAVLAQQARRERERNEREVSPRGNVMPSRAALAQRLRRQRERSGESSQLSLLPSRRQHACLEPPVITSNVTQPPSTSTETNLNSPKRTMRAHASTSLSITGVFPQTPILVDTTVGARTLITPNSVTSCSNASNQVDLHSTPQPRNLNGEFITLTPEMDRYLIYFYPYISLLLSILPI
jgi:hypothetical protein